MTTDYALICEVERLAKCEKWVTAHERESIDDLVRDYKTACSISRGPDKKRAAYWSLKALRYSRELQRYYQILSGVDWINLRVVNCKGSK